MLDAQIERVAYLSVRKGHGNGRLIATLELEKQAVLAFIDESGHPHPKDSCTRPVILAVCAAEDQMMFITWRIFVLNRQL